MSMNNKYKLKLIFLLILFFAQFIADINVIQAQASEQEYIIGPGDLLQIKFWQKPEYNTESRVSASGSIEIPLIGSIQASGLTPSKLRQSIEGRISILDVNITQVAVIVREYGSKNVYVMGGVLTPGKLSFEVIPNLWQIILEAGGPLPTSQLDNVTIVRGATKDAGKIIHADVTRAFELGDFTILPPIYPDDTVHIIGGSSGTGATGTTNPNVWQPSPLERRDAVYIFGEVRSPGKYNIEKNMDLLDAIVLAGGATENANLKKVRLFFRGRKHSELAIVNLNNYMNKSFPLPLTLNPGDAVYVPGGTRMSPFLSNLTSILISTLASFILYREIYNE